MGRKSERGKGENRRGGEKRYERKEGKNLACDKSRAEDGLRTLQLPINSGLVAPYHPDLFLLFAVCEILSKPVRPMQK